MSDAEKAVLKEMILDIEKLIPEVVAAEVAKLPVAYAPVVSAIVAAVMPALMAAIDSKVQAKIA